MTGVVITPDALWALYALHHGGVCRLSGWPQSDIDALLDTGLMSEAGRIGPMPVYSITDAGERFGHKYSWGVIGEYTP